MKLTKFFLGLCALCAFALSALADPPTGTVNPRNSILTLAGTNGVGFVTLVNTNSYTYPGTTNGVIWAGFTNVILTAPFQHGISVTTIITPTNACPNGTNIAGSTAGWTNYFDVGKVINTPSNGTNNYSTNWTTSSPIQISGTFNNLVSPQVNIGYINYTNFDGFDLIKLTKIGQGGGNNYGFEVVLGQTP